MSLLDQSGVTGGGLDPYNVHALFVNMNNMWTESLEITIVLLNMVTSTYRKGRIALGIIGSCPEAFSNLRLL